MKLSNFFKEGKAESFGRLASALLILAGVLIAFVEVGFSLYQYAWNNATIFPIHTGLILEFILIGKGGKVASKWLENKTPQNEDNQVN